jgi:hypothetical protein
MKKRKPGKFPFLFVAGGVLLLLAAVLIFTQNGAGQTIPQTPVSNAQAEQTDTEIARVPLAEAKSALDAGSAVFLDVRDAESYASSHITGSLNIPVWELETRLTELNPNQRVFTYCT